MEVHLYFKIGMVKRINDIHFHNNSNLIASRTQFMLRNFWIFMPAAYYIAMLCMYSEIQSYLGLKCQRNFIVDLDNILFGEHIYSMMEHIQHWSLDILSAVPYLIHFSLPFIYSAYIYFLKNDTNSFLKYCLAFGLVNLCGVLSQSVFPTPPPWMLKKHMENTIPEANFARVDSFLSINLFKNIYAKSPLVCGAFPSLHTAWPIIILCIRPWISVHFCRIHVLLIVFAAIYSGHHFVIDVVFGLVYAWVFSKASIFLINKRFPYNKNRPKELNESNV